jgi:hypothetical protein
MAVSGIMEDFSGGTKPGFFQPPGKILSNPLTSAPTSLQAGSSSLQDQYDVCGREEFRENRKQLRCCNWIQLSNTPIAG